MGAIGFSSETEDPFDQLEEISTITPTSSVQAGGKWPGASIFALKRFEMVKVSDWCEIGQ